MLHLKEYGWQVPLKVGIRGLQKQNIVFQFTSMVFIIQRNKFARALCAKSTSQRWALPRHVVDFRPIRAVDIC